MICFNGNQDGVKRFLLIHSEKLDVIFQFND